MRARSFAYAAALVGLGATLAATTMLGRRLAALGAERNGIEAALLDLTTGAAAAWFWPGLIAALVWVGAWWLAERHALPGERDAAGRKALLYAGQLAALGGFSAQAILLAAALLMQPQGANVALQAIELAVGAALSLAFWVLLRWITVGDGDFGHESAPAAGWRRFYYYAAAGVALILFLVGLMELLRIILAVVLGLGATAVAGDRGRFARAAAFALIAAPLWWALWWRQQTIATIGGVMAAVERQAMPRRLYLYAVILFSAVAFFFGLGMCIFGAAMGRDLSLIANWAPVALVASICLAGHLWTLRGDERALREAPGAAGQSRPMEADQSGAAGPRRFARAGLQLAAGPRRPIILVVDGGDGAVGAQVIAGLAAGLPQAILWPLGLNAAAQVALLDALGGAPPAVPADAAARAALIVGPADIVIAGGLGGEVGPELAAAIAESPALKLLLPPRSPALRWVAAPAWPLERWVENAVIEATNALNAGR